MRSGKVIETIGRITKIEHLTTVRSNILPDTLVLRNSNPFPGYKQQENNSYQKPVSIFLILRYRYAPEKIIRITKKLKQQKDFRCNAGYGEIFIDESVYPCIRIKGIDCISQISHIQELYKINEIQFMPDKKINADGKIKIFKIFKISEIDEGLYRDYYEAEKFYIKIPHDVNWNNFLEIIRIVRKNLRNPEYDAAMGIIYRFSGPEEVIRIYDRNKSLERAQDIKNEFLKEIGKKELHDINH